MAQERTWNAVPPVLFTADGTTEGIIQIADTAGFYFGQQATISNTLQTKTTVYVKKVVNSTTMWVGPTKGGQDRNIDLSAYTVAGGAYIEAAEQNKSTVPMEGQRLATYETDPVNAWRTISVDEYGNHYTDANPLPVAFSTDLPNVVEIKGSPSGDLLNVNGDGSINVNIITTVPSNQTPRILYNEVLAVASGVTTTILTYTVPAATISYLQKVMVSGENIGRFDVLIGSNSIATKRTWWSDFNADFDFAPTDIMGYPLSAGTIVKINVLHNSPTTGTFDTTLQLVETT